MRWTIRRKLMAAFLFLILLSSTLSFIGVRGLDQVAGNYADLSGRILKSALDTRLIDTLQAEQTNIAITYAITGQTHFRDEFFASVEEARETFADLEESVGEEAKPKLQAVYDTYEAFREEAEATVNRGQALPGAIEGVTLRLQNLHEAFQVAINDLIEYQEARSAERSVTAEETHSLTQTISMVLAAAAAMVGLLWAWLMSGSIAKPVVAVTEVARQLASGNLRVEPLRVKVRDEIGDLADACNRLVHDLREVIGSMAMSTEAVLTSSHGLSEASGQSAKAAQEAAQGAGELAQGAGEQAQVASDVSRTAGELQVTISQIASSSSASAAEVPQAAHLLKQASEALVSMAAEAEGVATDASETAAVARRGADAVSQTADGMGRIRVAVGESAEEIQALAQVSAQIGEITAVISNIAEQTNLLALNAAIEAARAGEHGRGFSVVAEEVRKLAERSAGATREIGSLIESIQSRTSKVVTAMANGTAEVEKGSHLAAEAGERLQEILAAVEQAAVEIRRVAAGAGRVQQSAEQAVRAFDSMAALIEENTAATEQMSASSAQVSTMAESIAKVSQENAASTEEVSASIEELTAASEQVASSAHSLAQVARELQQQAGRFQI